MKLDHLLACGAIINAEQSERGEKVRVVIDDEIELPAILIEHARNNVNETLRLKSLEDDQASDPDRDAQEWRNIDIRLYSEGSINAFFEVVDRVRKMVECRRPLPSRNEQIPF